MIDIEKCEKDELGYPILDMSNVNTYDCVEDIIEKVLREKLNIQKYSVDDVLEDEENIYVTGCICKVKSNCGGLQIKNSDNKWSDIYFTKSYYYAEYYKLSEIESAIKDFGKE